MPSPHLADLAEPDGPTLMSYLGWLRRRWWIVLLVAFLGSGAALIVTQVQAKSYISDTKLLVRQVGSEANQTLKVNLDTEAQVVRSLVVAERAKALMSSGVSADELVKYVTVTVPPNSQILQITFEAGTPKEAQAGSHAFAQAYLDLRTATAQRALENEQAALKKQIEEVNKQLRAVAGQIAGAAENSSERERAEAEKTVLTQQLNTLNGKLAPLLSTARDPGEIISDARLPTKPSSPNRTLNLASGLGAGLLFGIVLALVLDRLDTRVRRGRDITDRLGLPVLLELPSRPHGLAILPAAHRTSRELGRLRNVLLTMVPEPRVRGNGRLLLLTDVSDSPAAGFVVGNLAAAFARTGQQVAVVTTKRNSPLKSMINSTGGGYGLANVLRRDVTALKALTPVTNLPQLRVLLPGDLDDEVELPISAVLEVLAELSARFDHVLVETASPILASEAQALASHVDAVLVIAESGHTRSGEIAAALRQFEQVDAPVLGAVMAPRMPSTGRPASAFSRPAAGPTQGTGPRGGGQHGGGQHGGGQPLGKERKPRLILPQPSESTIILPRLPQQHPQRSAGQAQPPQQQHPQRPVSQQQPQQPPQQPRQGHQPPQNPQAHLRDDGMPGTGTGTSTTYKSTGDVNRSGGPRLTVALDSGEDMG